MAYDGELVKMANGRWARYQRCQVHGRGGAAAGETMMLIAVELEPHFQELLDSASSELAQYRHQGIPVRAAFDPDAAGKPRLSLQASQF